MILEQIDKEILELSKKADKDLKNIFEQVEKFVERINRIAVNEEF